MSSHKPSADGNITSLNDFEGVPQKDTSVSIVPDGGERPPFSHGV